MGVVRDTRWLPRCARSCARTDGRRRSAAGEGVGRRVQGAGRVADRAGVAGEGGGVQQAELRRVAGLPQQLRATPASPMSPGASWRATSQFVQRSSTYQPPSAAARSVSWPVPSARAGNDVRPSSMVRLPPMVRPRCGRVSPDRGIPRQVDRGRGLDLVLCRKGVSQEGRRAVVRRPVPRDPAGRSDPLTVPSARFGDVPDLTMEMFMRTLEPQAGGPTADEAGTGDQG